MKKCLILCSVFMLAVVATGAPALTFSNSSVSRPDVQPQEKTLLGTPVKHGIYAAPVLKFSAFGSEGEGSLVVGAQGGWILDHRFVLGLGVYGLSTIVKAAELQEIAGLVTIFNYGGLMFSYIHDSYRLIHAEATMLVGVGEVNYRDEVYWAKYPKGDNFLVFEPGVNLILNVTSGFRAGVGLSYRTVSRMNIIGLESGDVGGLIFNLLLQVGYF